VAAVKVTHDAVRNYLPKGELARRLHPLPDFGCIYVRNAKAATSTTLLWLHRVQTSDHGFVPDRNIHKEHKLPRVEDVGWDEVLKMLNGAAFRFAFVRDPIRRLESAYLSKIMRLRRNPGRAALQEILGLSVDPAEDLTFEQFIAAIEMQDPLLMNAHWRPQHLNLGHGLIEYDLVGRLETFATDMARIRETTGMADIPLPQRNASKRGATAVMDGRPDLVRKIREIYARDFELYGY
jgi:hypothetical protein